MSKVIHSCRQFLCHLTSEGLCDCFWPHAASLPEATQKRELELEANDIALLDGIGQDRNESERQAALDGIDDLFSQERDRRASVDSRLSAVLSLATPANALIVGIIAFLTARETAFGVTATVLVLLIGVYIITQLVCAIRGAVRGLARRGYQEPTPSAKLPRADEQRADHLLRQTRESLQCLHDHRRNNNAKVTQMAIAHRAIENAVIGFLLVIAVLFISAVFRGCTDTHVGVTTSQTAAPLKDVEAMVTTLERNNVKSKKHVETLQQTAQEMASLQKDLGDLAKDAIEMAANAKKDADFKIRVIEDQNTEMRNAAKKAEQAKNEAEARTTALEKDIFGLKKVVQKLEQAARDANVKVQMMEQQIAGLKKRVAAPQGHTNGE
jgi:hypothetical protein